MGIVDVFSKEDRCEVTYSNFYALVRAAAEKDILMNGIKTRVPHEYLEAVMTGERVSADGQANA